MPNVPITLSGNMDESVNALMKDMLTSTEKSKLTHAAALEYVNTLEEIRKESKDTIRDCLAIQKKQAEVNGSKDGNELLSRWKPCQQEFLTLNAFVAAGVKKHKTVPPLSADIKSGISPDLLTRLEATRDLTEKFRELAKKTFKQTFKNHEDIKAFLKNIKEKIEEKKAANPSVVPIQNVQVPNFLHSNQKSQNQAAAASKPASVAPNNQNSKAAK